MFQNLIKIKLQQKIVSHLKLKTFLLLMKGLIIGVVLVIPGGSAGTMAWIMRLYTPLIDFLNTFSEVIFRKKQIKDLLQYFSHLLPVFIGILSGFFIAVYFMIYFIKAYSIITYALFSGIIIASIPFLFKQMKKSYGHFILFIFSSVFVFSMSFFHSIAVEGYLWLLFSVYIAVAAMLLPGISGSYILVLMGSYVAFLESFTSPSLNSIGVILVIVLSIFTFSKWIQYSLKNHKYIMMSFLTGMTLGGGIGIFPFKIIKENHSGGFSSIVFFFLGALLYLVIQKGGQFLAVKKSKINFINAHEKLK